jgi:hypothetical protein
MTRTGTLAAAFVLFGGVALLLLALALAPSASAPTTSRPQASGPLAQVVVGDQDQPNASDQSNASYSDKELRSFAEAAMEVKHIKEVYIPQIVAATSEDEQQKLEEAATKEMTKAVEDRGLKVGRYQEILAAALTQPELAHKVGKYMSQPRAWV